MTHKRSLSPGEERANESQNGKTPTSSQFIWSRLQRSVAQQTRAFTARWFINVDNTQKMDAGKLEFSLQKRERM